jgi:hypothetical protein
MRTVVCAFVLAIWSAACSGSGSPPTTPTAPEPYADLKALVGAYTLTIETDQRCSQFPSAARRRSYRATFEDRGWHFLLVNVAGGGFAEETMLGNLFSAGFGTGQLTLQWNAGDVVDCRTSEPLDGGRSLALCGFGPLAQTPAGLRGTISGSAAVSVGGGAASYCSGEHLFSFERESGNVS